MAKITTNELIVRSNDNILGYLRRMPDGQGYQFEYVLKDFWLPGMPLNQTLHYSPHIWPWFINRIPNRKSPMFKRFAGQYHLDPEDLDDDWTLVATMGSQNIKDWFVIEPSPRCDVSVDTAHLATA
jgi:hypothetical protein